MLSRKLGIKLYDSEFIRLAAERSGIDEEYILKNEQSIPSFWLKCVFSQSGGITPERGLSADDVLFVAESRIVQELSEREPCVIVGRCADFILRDSPRAIKVFCYCDASSAQRRCVEEYGIPADRAESEIRRINRNRGAHYEYYTGGKWGDCHHYHLMINTGSISLREIPYPAWVEPEAAGQTPMCEALRRVRDIAAAWCADPAHAESFPPMVFNITDGEATDCDDAELRAVAGQIKSLRTADGNVLVVNIHIAAGDTPRTVFFPSVEEASYPNRYATVLYDCSSPMPEVFNEAIREAKGPGALPPFRGMSFNASAEELITMLNIGSISVKTE